MIRDFVEHGSHDPEEFPFLEELHALRRLLATLYCLRNWATTKAHATLHTWQVRDFLLITQADLLNMEDCFVILQVSGMRSQLKTYEGSRVQYWTSGFIVTHSILDHASLIIQ